MNPRLRRLLPAATLAATLAVAGCGGDSGAPPAPKTPLVDSHSRMVTFLARLAERADEENPFLGRAGAAALRQDLARLPDDADPFLHLRLHYETASAELRLGNTREAIEHFTSAYELLEALAGQLTDEQRNLTTFQLAVAYLRLGETENCVDSLSPDACLIPIRGGGIHTRDEGSTRAIPYLEEVIANSEPDGRLHLTARWLLNIAHMTLGTWPDGVPAEDRIPAAAFDAGVPFPRFRDVATDVGLDAFSLAGGVCIDDFDGDDVLDVIVSTWDTAGPMRFFHSNGDGSYTERTDVAGLTGLLSGLNMVHADYDNDGDADVYVLRGAWLGSAGRHPNSLLRNDGGTFRDVTFDAGLGTFHYPTQAASFADYDNDGDLDLYVGNESSQDFDPEQLRAIGYESVVGLHAPAQLFRNEGNGTFTDIATHAGVTNERYAKGVTWGDIDNDGDADLYVSNYASANRLYRNEGDGTFTDIATHAGVARPFLGFPTWFFDYDNDGALDLFASSYSGTVASVAGHYLGLPPAYEPALLAHGDGRGGFTDVTEQAGLLYPMLPMGANFGDIDSDGFPDIYLGTGSPSYANLMPNVLFLNRGGRGFVDVSYQAGVSHLQKGHGVAFADLDHDGDLDLFEQLGGAYPGDAFRNTLYQNPGFDRHSLTVQLVGVRSNRSAIGARIHARFRENGAARSVYRHVGTGGSFGSSPLRQFLGLGSATVVDTLEVFWPATGKTQAVTDVPADQAIRIVEGEDGFAVIPVRAFTLSKAAAGS
ncbi:FG-GAP-like repeat-containing protein [bacterium]|nr:FG-GAP-like repeat-containing protein [bacterium]